jgi:TNF receptor-associated protein 1
LTDTPAIIVDHESGSFRRMMKYVDPEHAPSLPKQQVEINPKHPVILGVNALRTEAPEKAKIIIEQVLNVLIST